MSRAKFEEWATKRGHPLCDVVPKYGPASSMPQSEYRFSDIAYEAWLAGRESMRDEAAQVAHQYAHTFQETKRTHQRLSPKHFDPREFGFDMQRVMDSNRTHDSIMSIEP